MAVRRLKIGVNFVPKFWLIGLINWTSWAPSPIIKGDKNLGFGVANNKAAKLGNSEYIFFLNVDTEIEKDTFKKLSLNIKNSSSDFAVFELRQKPYEHPKYYDPVTQETTWASGACMVIKRSIFNILYL